MKNKVAITTMVALVAMAAPAWAETPAEFMKAVDANHDKTISLPEVQAYALKRFRALDSEKDGTLTKAELGDRMSDADFKVANTRDDSKGATLSKAEFSVYVSKLFAEANKHVKTGRTDVDGTLSEEELATPAGARLIKLLE